MKNFIVPADMTNEQVDELGVEMTMSILFNALCEVNRLKNCLKKAAIASVDNVVKVCQ